MAGFPLESETVLFLKETDGDSAAPNLFGATSVLANAAPKSRYPAPTVKMS